MCGREQWFRPIGPGWAQGLVGVVATLVFPVLLVGLVALRVLLALMVHLCCRWNDHEGLKVSVREEGSSQQLVDA